MNPIIRKPISGKVRQLSLPYTLKKDLIVWWYGAIRKNTRAESVPYVVVVFRDLDEQNNPGKFIQIPIGLPSLELLRIGSIWRKGICTSEAAMVTEDFHVDFTEGAWRWVSPYEEWKKGNNQPLDPVMYRLQYEHDVNWLIEFPQDNGQRILIPCLEFFSRCYGRSAEVNRILATYPWNEVKKRFFAPLDQPAQPNQWPVKLTKRMRNGDVTLLAHVLYDDYARLAAKSIYGQLEGAYEKSNNNYFVQVRPWFQGGAQIRLKGVLINDGQTFLGLQILGCSDPSGAPILRDRENTNKVTRAADGDGVDEAWDGVPRRIISKLPDIVDLTDDNEPDQGSASVDIEESDFIVMGEPRVIIDVRRDKATSTNGKSGQNDDSSKFSSGDPYGTGKGTGQALITARPVMESSGTLRDVWNALVYLKKARPDLVASVEWFTFEDGFCNNQEPRLIALEPYKKNENKKTDVKNWLYYDVTGKLPRGVLIARVQAEGKFVYIVEIQRRPRSTKDASGNIVESEESYKGFVFVLDNQHEFVTWLRRLLADIRNVKGVVQRLIGRCPGKAGAFKHTPATDEAVLCEAAVLNAFRKVGIEI